MAVLTSRGIVYVARKVSGARLTPIRDVDFVLENSQVGIIVNRNFPEIQLVGLKAGLGEEEKNTKSNTA